MSTLQTLKLRIRGVKSTQKITKAMRMVAASRLRRCKEQLGELKPYANKISDLIRDVAANPDVKSDLLLGKEDNPHVLLVVMGSDRGLCGPFNGAIAKEAIRQVDHLQAEGKKVYIYCVGKKPHALLKGKYRDLVIEHISNISKKELSFEDAITISSKIISLFDDDRFGQAKVIYTYSKNVLTQEVRIRGLIPMESDPGLVRKQDMGVIASPCEFEPNEEQIIKQLAPHNIAVQVFYSMVQNCESEYGARMNAMDSASKNASEMIGALTLEYNRKRQASITKELIEIISGAEAV